MLTQITDILEFLEVQIMRGHDKRVMLLNIQVFERVSSTCVMLMGADKLLPKYGTPSILRNNLDCGRQGRISLDSRLLSPLEYFSIKMRSLEAATMLVVIVMPFHNSLM